MYSKYEAKIEQRWEELRTFLQLSGMPEDVIDKHIDEFIIDMDFQKQMENILFEEYLSCDEDGKNWFITRNDFTDDALDYLTETCRWYNARRG